MDATPARRVAGHRPLFTRVQTYVPATVEIPDIVKPVFDDSYIEITDTQTWDDTTPLRQSFSIRPGVLADFVKSEGQVVMEALSDGGAVINGEGKDAKRGDLRGVDGCLHVLSGECRVSIPFVGWYVEQAIVANMTTFYDAYPKHVKAFVDLVVKRWGDGSVESLRDAVDRMLAEEKELD